MNHQRLNVHKLTLSGLFIALSILIPALMPIKFTDGVFSATLAAHVPIVLSMFISPAVAAAVAAGSALGFIVSLGPIVALRASMHIPFALVGSIMIKKKRPLWMVYLVTTILHAGFEALIVLILFAGFMIDLKGKTLGYTTAIILGGTAIHYTIDCLIAMVIYKPLEKPYFARFNA